MFILLLVVNFLLAFAVCFIVARIFKNPINKILQRLIADDIYAIWTRYIIFAIYVVGVSGGVRVWDLEKYISPQSDKSTILELNLDRWVLEIYRTIIGTLQSVAWMLLLFFIFALIAYVIVKGMELKKQNKP
jgi:hypothetical protein